MTAPKRPSGRTTPKAAKPTGDGRTFDLGAHRRERAANGPEPYAVVTDSGDRFELPSDLPLGVLDALGRAGQGDPSGFLDAMRLLFGVDNYAELITEHGLGIEEASLIVSDAYEVGDVGKLSASPAS